MTLGYCQPNELTLTMMNCQHHSERTAAQIKDIQYNITSIMRKHKTSRGQGDSPSLYVALTKHISHADEKRVCFWIHNFCDDNET